jgi:uncharacterized protein
MAFDPNVPALYEAIDQGNVAAVQALLDGNAELRTRRLTLGNTWLHVAARDGHVPVVQLLVEMGFDVNAPSGDNPETPLHYAALNGRVDVARWLLDHGADINAREETGRTPLMFAVLSGSLDTVRLLLQRNADVHLRSTRKPPDDALSLAVSRRNEKMAQLLREHGAEKRGRPSRRQISLDQRIVQHIEDVIGPVDPLCLTEMVPAEVPFAIHVARDENRLTLFTTGMSEQAMKAPKGASCSPYVELLIDLPAGWPLDREAFDDAAIYWPIEWLRRLVHHAHDQGACLCHGDTIGNGEPPKPLAPGTKLSCLLLLQDPETGALNAGDRMITFLRLFPLHDEERRFCEANGLMALLQLFDEHGVTEMVDPRRRSVVPKPKKRKGRG